MREENLRRARATGNQRMEAMSLESLALSARDEGRLQDALSMLGKALRIYRGVGALPSTVDSLSRFARVLAIAGGAATAAQLLSSSVALYEKMGVNLPLYMTKRNEETLSAIRAQLNEAAFAEAWEQGRALTVDEAVALVLDS